MGIAEYDEHAQFRKGIFAYLLGSSAIKAFLLIYWGVQLFRHLTFNNFLEL